MKCKRHSSHWSFCSGHRTTWHCSPDRLSECLQRQEDARGVGVRRNENMSHTNRNYTDCSGMQKFQSSSAYSGRIPTCHPDTLPKQASFLEGDGVEGEGLRIPSSTPRRGQSYRYCSDSDGVPPSPSSRRDTHHMPTHRRNLRTRVTRPPLPEDAHETGAP